MKITLKILVLLMVAFYSSASFGVVLVDDNFDTAHNYDAAGVTGTQWDGFQYSGDTGDVIASAGGGNLSLASSNGTWENGGNDGIFLYKAVAGDFLAEMHVPTGQAVNYNDVTLMARVANDADAGAGEDYVQARAFFAQNLNGYRTVDNSGTYNSPAAGDGLYPYLRLQRRGNTFSFYRKYAAGDAWTLFDTVGRADMDGLALQVGVSQATYVGNIGTAEVDYVKIIPEPATICLLTFGSGYLLRRKRSFK